MRLPHRTVVHIVYIFNLLSWIQKSEAKKSKNIVCPIGFYIAYNTISGDFVCYKRKELETFDEILDDCDGNLYTSKLYRNLNISKLDDSDTLWTEYKSFYPGGPFVSWSQDEERWSSISEVNYQPSTLKNELDRELCLVINNEGSYTAVECDKKIYRYCFIKPYPEKDEMTKKGCENFRGAWRFDSPREICLLKVTGVGGGTIRATWSQAQALCAKNGGSLLSHGWQYANLPLLHTSGVSPSPMYPLGIIWDQERKAFCYIAENNTLVEAPFEPEPSLYDLNETRYISIQDQAWLPVDSFHVFFDVICENPVRPRNISLKLRVTSENKIILTVNGSVDKDDIHCTTDSNSYKPAKVKIHHDDDNDVYILSPIKNGYYWCEHTDRHNQRKVKSDKVLFVREKDSLVNLYAIQIYTKRTFKFEDAEHQKSEWKDKIEEFIFYRTKYKQMFDDKTDPIEAETLKGFKDSRPELSWKDGNQELFSMDIKRLYMDKQTVLLHAELNPEMMPVTHGSWEDLEIKFMKPAYFCKGFDSVPRLSIGESVYSKGCRKHSCIGDFNTGVQWLVEGATECNTTASRPMTVTVKIDDDSSSSSSDEELKRDSQRENIEIALQFQENMFSTQTDETDKTTNIDINIQEVGSTTDSNKLTSEGLITAIPTFSDVETPEYITTTRIYPIVINITEATPTTTENPEYITTTRKYPIVINITEATPTTTADPTISTTVLPSNDQLKIVIQDLKELLQNETESISIYKADTTFDKVNMLLESNEDLEIPGELLHMLDKLGSRINLNGSQTAKTVKNNIALLLADSDPDKPVRGLRMSVMDSGIDAFTNNSFEFLANEFNSTQLSLNESEALVYLPESVVKTHRRLSFVVYRNERAFPSKQNVTVNSRVVSVNVENVTEFDAGEVIDIHLAPTVEDPERNVSRACAYWHLENETGHWSQEGCTFIKSDLPGTLDTCRCTHLTHFAEILVPRTNFTPRSEDALEILSIVGCSLSILGIALIILTAVMFRTWRREFSNKIWLQLCIALLLLIVCFLIVVFAKFDGYDVPCMLTGVALHYSVIASFCWMLVAAVLSYKRLVLVFSRQISHKLLRASAFSWGAPFAVVGILLSIDPHAYEGRYEEKTPSGSFCYPSGLALWLAVYAPIAVMLLANWTLFILIVRSVFASRRIQRHGDANEALRCACVSCLLVFLFGLPWIFGLFAYNVVAAYFFTCTTTFQGFILFIFIVLANKKTRDLWLNTLKIKHTSKVPVTTSTYVNRSVGGAWRTPDRSISSMEAKNLKPKSLTIQDDSRFS